MYTYFVCRCFWEIMGCQNIGKNAVHYFNEKNHSNQSIWGRSFSFYFGKYRDTVIISSFNSFTKYSSIFYFPWKSLLLLQ